MQAHRPPATYQRRRLLLPTRTFRMGVNTPPAPDLFGTLFFISALMIGWLGLPTNETLAVARHAAYWAGGGLAVTALFDLRHGFRNMMRADLWMLLALYALTFVEYLDPRYTEMANNYGPEFMKKSVEAVLISMGVLAVSRHLVHTPNPPQSKIFTIPTRSSVMLVVFWFCFLVGFMHQWVAVRFNPVAWFDGMVAPRFAAPWGRGMLGNFYALFFELGMLLNLISPVGALILVKWRKYGLVQVTMVAIAMLITLFYFFSEGTRHKFCGQIVMFVIAYCYFLRNQPVKTILIFISGFAIMFLSAKSMLAFRQVGLKSYWEARNAGVSYLQDESALFVDNNLVNLGRVLEIWPQKQPYLGWDVFYYALIRPIPRALWPGKPLGVVEAMTEGLQEEGSSLTYSITFIGEAWLAYGWFSVIASACGFGALAAWWNRFGTLRTSEFGLLIYASGFLGFVIAMRSLMVFTTFLLPCLFLMLAASYFVGEVLPHQWETMRRRAAIRTQQRGAPLR